MLKQIIDIARSAGRRNGLAFRTTRDAGEVDLLLKRMAFEVSNDRV